MSAKQLFHIMSLKITVNNRQLNGWSLRCSWSIGCRRCSNHIFILHLTRGLNILHKDNCKPRRETFKFWDLVHLILEILRYIFRTSSTSPWDQWAKQFMDLTRSILLAPGSFTFISKSLGTLYGLCWSHKPSNSGLARFSVSSEINHEDPWLH